MYGFKFTSDQVALQKMAHQFVENEIKPVAAHYDETEEFPWDVVRKAHEVGLMNLEIPEEYGGQGLDHVTACMVAEEMSVGCAGISNAISANSLATLPILIAGTHEQKEKFLKPLCAEPKLAAFGLTEPQAGSDVASLRTTARRDGDYYVLNGTKCFITNGGVASLYTIFATMDSSKKAKGICAFIVPRDTPGLSIGKRELKMGIRSSNVSELIFEDMRVPKENLLGQEGEGFRIAMKTLDVSRPGVGAAAVGIARAALEHAIAYSKERVTFGHPIGENQGIQFMLADMATAVDAARLLVLRSAWMLDDGQYPTKEGAMAKLYAGDVAMKVATDAVQIFGGYGFMREYPVEKLMRDAKIYQIFEGTNQIQRMVISREILR
ncbi:MAG: acyl-CoA dehydrogenase family protein [Desulfitobacteriaceae bacterium]